MYSILITNTLLAQLLAVCIASNPAVEWKEDWSEELPPGAKGTHSGWVGFSSGQNGGKYVENGWQDSWHAGNSGDDSGWSSKQLTDGGWSGRGRHKWSWGNGGAKGWGSWGSNAGKHNGYSTSSDSGDVWKDWATTRDCCFRVDPERAWGDFGPEQGYISWGNVNSDSWKNSGGGEGWSKWEGDGHRPGEGKHQQGGWKGWKSGSGGGTWNSWKTNKPISAKAEAYASISADP